RNAFTVTDADHAVTIGALLGLAVAVAGLVDQTARHARAARRASQDAELLAMFADGVLHDADPAMLLERVRETYAQRSVSLLEGRSGEVLAHAGTDPCTDIDNADTTIEIGDDEYWLLLAGPDLTSHDHRVLNAVADQAVTLVKKRRQTDEAIKFDTEAEKLRGSILSAITQNLRTPLVTAKEAMARASHDNPGSPDDTVNLLTAAERSVDELAVLVGNLLDSSCLATGAVRPELRPVQLRDAVNHALHEIGPGAGRVQVDVDETAVSADGELLERVLSNLIVNSLHYGDGGTVRVTAGQVDDRVLIAVVDGGPGIPRGSETEAFAPFRRLGRDDANIGVGLGLPVASGLVEAMGGKISVTETPGGGLTVEIDLPATSGSD
ncbi:MAG TPA: ATP-binding protein, partial [Actinopolymorphaceae bacterium]